jgi:hypothetical protein
MGETPVMRATPAWAAVEVKQAKMSIKSLADLEEAVAVLAQRCTRGTASSGRPAALETLEIKAPLLQL